MFLESIVIGSCAESATYAFLSDSYFLPVLQPPLFYEKINNRFLGSGRKDYHWSRMVLFMALSGKLLTSKSVKKVRIRDNSIAISYSDGSDKYQFGLCNIFNTTLIDTENTVIKYQEPLYHVYDDFELSSLGERRKHIESKMSSHDLAREIHYYISQRVDGANFVTDCLAYSLLNKEQLNDPNFSDFMARFSVERHLTSLGINGIFMKYYKNGNVKYRKPKVVHKKRISVKEDKNIYQDSSNVKFMNLEMEKIFDLFSAPGQEPSRHNTVSGMGFKP